MSSLEARSSAQHVLRRRCVPHRVVARDMTVCYPDNFSTRLLRDDIDTRRDVPRDRLSIEPARPYVPAIFAATMNQWRFTGLADDACPMGAAFRTARRKIVGWIFPMCSHESHRMNMRAGSDHDVPLTQVCMLPHFGQPGSRATQAELTNGVPFVTAKIPLGSSLSRCCMPHCGAADYGTVNKSKRN